MRILIAPLGSPGFVFAALAVAERLRARGHEVGFVTDRAFAGAIAGRGFERFPNGTEDAPSFQLDGWFDPVRIALQLEHLSGAIRAHPPDVVLASNLAMGPLLLRVLTGVPTVVLGPVVLLWPGSPPAGDEDPVEGRLRWRYADQLRHLARAAELLRLQLPEEPYERSPLFGDRYLLQGVPALQRRTAALPAPVRFVGSCTFDALEALPPHDATWLRRQRAQRRRIVYVQLGRVFDKPSIWAALRARLERGDLAAVVCAERYDRPLDDVPASVLVRARVPQDAVLAYAAAAVCTGHPTAVLGAIARAVPLAIAPAGSGTEELQEACVRCGAAVALDADDPAALPGALERLLADPAFARAAAGLRDAFGTYDGPENVCRELEAVSAGRLAGAGAR
jgi:UDP:flavonoid glycosyltransferase YjiC (YdhE family)